MGYKEEGVVQEAVYLWTTTLSMGLMQWLVQMVEMETRLVVQAQAAEFVYGIICGNHKIFQHRIWQLLYPVVLDADLQPTKITT